MESTAAFFVEVLSEVSLWLVVGLNVIVLELIAVQTLECTNGDTCSNLRGLASISNR